MSLYCQHLLGKSLLISTVQDIHSLCGLLTCGINGISLKSPVAAPAHGVRLVAEGDALLPHLRQPLAVDLDAVGSGSRGVVSENIAHVVEQPGG